MSSPLLRLDNIGKVYKSRNADSVRALSGVSLEVFGGEYLSILGKSGSGKSTLMNVLGCLDKPDSGSYLFCGKNVAGMNENELSQLRRSSIGFVFQRFCLIPTLSAFDNVELPLIYAGVRRSERLRRVKNVLSTVGIYDRARHLPAELSGGQQQRVAIARAIVKDPPLILADEPTGNLDPETSRGISQLFLSLNKSGKTIVLITHDRSVAGSAGRIAVIEHGTLTNL